MRQEIVRYKIPETESLAFEESYQQMGEILLHSEHCLGFELLRSSTNRELYLLTIRWNSTTAHLEGFCRSELFDQFLELVRPYAGETLEAGDYEYQGLAWQAPPPKGRW